MLRAGRTVGVLPYDPARNAVVLIRQFRLPAWLMLGPEQGELVEIVAGGLEEGEVAEHAALRECAEETGLTPSHLVPMLRFLPTPGIIDEYASFFWGWWMPPICPSAGALPGKPS